MVNIIRRDKRFFLSKTKWNLILQSGDNDNFYDNNIHVFML